MILDNLLGRLLIFSVLRNLPMSAYWQKRNMLSSFIKVAVMTLSWILMPIFIAFVR